MDGHKLVYIFLIPLFPNNRSYFLRCKTCKHEITLRKSEIVKTKELRKLVNEYLTGQLVVLSSDQLVLQAMLVKCIAFLSADHINKVEMLIKILAEGKGAVD